jgi:hypothetical protein
MAAMTMEASLTRLLMMLGAMGRPRWMKQMRFNGASHCDLGYMSQIGARWATRIDIHSDITSHHT